MNWVYNTKDFIDKSNMVHNFRYTYPRTNYIGNKIKVIITCPIHGDFEQTPNKHLGGCNCQKCAKELPSWNKSNIEEFIKKANIKHNFFYDYSEFVYDGKEVKSTIICPIHGRFQQSPRHHLRGKKGHNCPGCNEHKKINQDIFVNRSNIIHDFKYSYLKTVFTTIFNKVTITCPIHGDFEQSPPNHMHGFGCPRCNDSWGEIEIVRILKELGINFEQQKVYNNCCGRTGRALRFDFYLPDYNICVEFDGEQHFSAVRFWGMPIDVAEEKFKLTQYNDLLKNKYCQDNHIVLIRIPYWDIDCIETDYLSLLKAA